jgi:hypothetical protein
LPPAQYVVEVAEQFYLVCPVALMLIAAALETGETTAGG